MISSLSKNEKLFLLHDAIFIIPLSVVGVFTNFFIWEKTDSLASIGVFQIFCGIGILVGAFISTILLNKFKPSTIRALGTFLSAVSIGLIAFFSSDISRFLILCGFVFGLAIGLRAQAYKLLFMKIIDVQSREKFLTLDKFIYSAVLILVPFITALFVGSAGYTIVFVAMIILFIISVFPLTMIRGEETVSTSIALGKAFSELRSNNDLKKLNFVKFFQGIHIGIDNSVWPIIVLSIVGSLQSWGIFNTIFAVLSAIVSYSFGKRIKFSNSKFFFALMAVVLTAVGLLFASNFDLMFYIIFSFVSGIASNLFDTAFQSIENKIKDRNVVDSETVDEINLLEEIPVFLGKIIPFSFVVIFNPTFENDILLRIFIVVVSTIPLVISSMLSSAGVVKRSDDPFIKG